MKPYVVAIAGASGSGKTHLLNELVRRLGPEVITDFNLDHFYKPIEQQQKDPWGIENFDLPTAFDQEAMATAFEQLRQGKPVSFPEYTFNNPDRVPGTVRLQPRPVLVAEGIFALHFATIRQAADLTVFLDVDLDVTLQRRIQRDAVERNYDEGDVRHRYEHHFLPSYERFVLPSAATVDLRLPNLAEHPEHVDQLEQLLRQQIG